MAATLLLATLRLLRRWNQTGQKQAGEPDIAKFFLPNHHYQLWLLVTLTYAVVVQQLAGLAMPWASRKISAAAFISLGTAAFIFKLAFTKADAPELLAGLESLTSRIAEGASLVTQARAVFVSIGIMTLIMCVPVRCRISSNARKSKRKFANRLKCC